MSAEDGDVPQLPDLSGVILATQPDPADLTYPPGFPMEIALKVKSVPDICDAYGVSKERWARLRVDPVFVADLKACVIELAQDGVTFKRKAAMQAEAFLQTQWNIVHDPTTPAAVKADLIKNTIKVAGLDASKEQVANGGQQNALQININLG